MVKNEMKLSFFTCLFFLTSFGIAQTKTFSPKGSFSIDMGVPTKPGNKAFATTMEGLLNMGVDYRQNVYKGWTVGGGLKYSFFTLNSFAFNSVNITGSYHMPGAYLMVGFEKFTTERVSFTGSLRGGYSYLLSVNDSCRALYDGPHVAETLFFEPQIEMVMLTDKVSPHGFSMVLGYSFYLHEFTKEDVGMDEISSISLDYYDGITRFLSIGFGYRYYLGRN